MSKRSLGIMGAVLMVGILAMGAAFAQQPRNLYTVTPVQDDADAVACAGGWGGFLFEVEADGNLGNKLGAYCVKVAQ